MTDGNAASGLPLSRFKELHVAEKSRFSEDSIPIFHTVFHSSVEN